MTNNEIVYCTYFDRGFLLRGLALHESLIRYAPNASLWIVAFDKYTEKTLKRMKLKGVTVIGINELEDKELLSVKESRSKVEYMWTTTPSIPLYIFKKKPSANYVIYLDADEYFFSSPASIIKELGRNSLLAVEHRYPKGREALNDLDGRFNVSVNVFKRDKTGIKCLKRWRNQCLEWCYWRFEDGKLGDQLYLNEWPDLYGKDLVISKNIGVNVAPWNVSQYTVSKKDNVVLVNKTPLVCYHFHQFQIFSPDKFNRVYGYTLSKNVIDFIYKPYETEIRRQYKKLKSIDPSFEIAPPIQYSSQIIRQKMGKYLGPVYWRLATLARDTMLRFKNDKK
jgi:hypothetical protein